MAELRITKVTSSFVEGTLLGFGNVNISIKFNGLAVRLFSEESVSINPFILSVYKDNMHQFNIFDIKLQDMMGKAVIGGLIENSKQSSAMIPLDQIKLMSCSRYDPTAQEWLVFLR